MKRKRTFIILAIAVLSIISAYIFYQSNSSSGNEAPALQKVESEYVCMINDAYFGRPQISVIVNGKTYYGCCPSCEAKLKNNINARMAIDPISKKQVDKATAVIGAKFDTSVLYFENEENMKAYKITP